MRKVDYRICPVCGEIYTHKSVEKIMLGHIDVSMSCPNEHSWIENYVLTYTGYEYKNKSFNKDGDEI